MSRSVTHFRDLRVWQEALNLAEAVHRASAGWPNEERFGLISQIRRSTVSIASNIAEGAARRSTGEFIQFVGMAQGSLAEAETQLLLAQRFGYLTTEAAQPLLNAASDVSRMLAALKASLLRRKQGQAQDISRATGH